MEKNLKDQIKDDLNLPESDFGTHESDLYVKYSPELDTWLLKHYRHYGNITKFFDATDRKTLWFDIPFGYANEHYAKQHPKQA